MESTNGIGNDSLLALNENTRSRSGGLLSSGNENDSNNGSISCDDNEDFDDEDVDEQREEIEAWISWFCSLPGHDYLLEVEETFIEDGFNLTGLSSLVPFYSEAIDAILDVELEGYNADELRIISESAELLYLLIHQRYLQSRSGLKQLYEKYCKSEFGHCPRVLCENQSVVPIGLFDSPGHDSMKLFCVRCLDAYHPIETDYVIDGCAFGTSAAYLMLQSFDNSAKQMVVNFFKNDRYVPKVFGFRLHGTCHSGAKMYWLREEVNDVQTDTNERHDPMVSSLIDGPLIK